MAPFYNTNYDGTESTGDYTTGDNSNYIIVDCQPEPESRCQDEQLDHMAGVRFDQSQRERGLRIKLPAPLNLIKHASSYACLQ